MRASQAEKITRLGLVLELADGSKVMVYADNLPHAEAAIRTETPVHEIPGDPWGRRRPMGPPRTSITLTGIESYRVVFTDPGAKVSNAGRALETFRREVRP